MKWIKRLIIGSGIAIAALIVLLLAVSSVVRQVAVRRAERDFPPPGQLVEIDNRLSHIYCTGSGSPTIFLESGLDDRGSWAWSRIHDDLSQISRVCAYDRAGIIWSEPRDGPRDAVRIADELHTLFKAAAEPPPYVMVGHSFGAVLVRVYDQRYPGEAMGFVFVDPSHPEQQRRFPPEVQELMSRNGSDPRWLFRLLAPYRIFTGERSTPRTAYWWRSFPEGVLAEVAAADLAFEQAALTGSLGDRPLVVLTAGLAPEIRDVSDEGNAALHRVLLELKDELAELSTNSDHRIVNGAGHYIHWDRPEAVIAAIRDVVTAVRETGLVRSEVAENAR